MNNSVCRNKISAGEADTLKSIVADIEASRQEKLRTLRARIKDADDGGGEIAPECVERMDDGDDISQGHVSAASRQDGASVSIQSGVTSAVGTRGHIQCAADDILHLSTPKIVLF